MSAGGPMSSPGRGLNGGIGGSSPTSNGFNNRSPVFAHLDDLRAQAGSGNMRHGSIPQLVAAADIALKQADTLLDMRRPDLSYVEFLRACEIIVVDVPRNMHWPDFRLDTNGGFQKYRVLQNKINGKTEQYEKIKEIIKNNNIMNGAQPKSGKSVQNHLQNGTPSLTAKPKPSISPKPENLHGNPVLQYNDTAKADAGSLSDRFAKLRASPVQSASSKPLGPRDMPQGASGLDNDLENSLPKPPEATYTPARNMQAAGNIPLPRHSARSLAPTSSRRSSTYAPTLHSFNELDTSQSKRSSIPPVNPNLAQKPETHRQFSMPIETMIEAGRLYDYLERFNVLLIDFRNRDHFENGHIYTRNIICIEPFMLTQGMSAEQLEDRMVLNPEYELEMFSQRDKFDLVVYHDRATREENFLSKPSSEQESKLKFLHETLVHYNQDKPLQRPPILLMGGLEAWEDLVGSQALTTSNTAAKLQQSRGAGIQRRPRAVPGGSSLHVAKRRYRDYNPLDEEEERKWRERARAESVVLPPPPETADEGRSEADDDATIRAFNDRFPDAGFFDQQSFSPSPSFGPTAAPPELPPKVPAYPPPPLPSQHPDTLARPQPTASKVSYTGVSERSISQSSAVVRSSPQLAPYIPAKYLSSNLRLPKTGLENFSSTCYMNATVQALSATIPLTTFFIDDAFKPLLQRDNWKGTKGVLPELYANLVRSLWKNDVSYIRPSTFQKFCGRLNKEWENVRKQQDAKEFLDFVMDALHEDLNGPWARTPLRQLTDQEEERREKMPKFVVAKKEWERYTHRDRSYITDLFAGQHYSKLTCCTCGTTSTQYEAFYSLSIEIPKSKSSAIPTLDDCLRSYCQEERLTTDHQWNCTRCKVPREATKKITITRVPSCLVMHFKRFDYASRGHKLRTPVDFPLDSLDLSPYTMAAPTAEESAHIARTFGGEELKADAAMQAPYLYDAYAVVRHIGNTMESGHYTTAVRDRARGPDSWRYFNDRSSVDFRPGAEGWKAGGDLRNEQAYIVFYQRKAGG